MRDYKKFKDKYWLAGFLEGEGYFGISATTLVVSAKQKQKEPLLRVQKILGGNIGYYKSGYKDNMIHHWSLSGSNARETMLMLYPVLSPRRKGQVRKALRKELSRRLGTRVTQKRKKYKNG